MRIRLIVDDSAMAQSIELMPKSDPEIKRAAAIEQPKPEQARQERIARGTEACKRAVDPQHEALLARETLDAIEDLTNTLDLITARLLVHNIRRSMNEATLAGNMDLLHKLQNDLQDASRTLVEKEAQHEQRCVPADADSKVL